MRFNWHWLLGAALASCSPGSADGGVPPLPDREEAAAPASTLDAAFSEDFRRAYAAALWSMMVLRWCDERWNRPRLTAEAEARLAAINAIATRQGLKPIMDQAGRDNARAMATMRLDVRCNGGFDRFHAAALKALAEVERLLRTGKQARGTRSG